MTTQLSFTWQDADIEELDVEYARSGPVPGGGQCPDDPGEIDVIKVTYKDRELNYGRWKEKFWEKLLEELWDDSDDQIEDDEQEAKISRYEDRMDYLESEFG